MEPLAYSLRNCLNRTIKDVRKYIRNPSQDTVQAAFQTVLQTGRQLNLKGRQGASTKRANSNFPSQGWKIVISQFNCLLTGRSCIIGTPSVLFHLFRNFQVEFIYINQGFKGLIRLYFSYSVCWVVSAVDLFDLRNLVLFVGLMQVYKVNHKPLLLYCTQFNQAVIKGL